MNYSTETYVNIDLDVDEIYDNMDENEKKEMLELLQEGKKDLFDQFDSEYQKIFQYLYNKYPSLQLENELKQIGILPDLF
jgi:hypothetical protein